DWERAKATVRDFKNDAEDVLACKEVTAREGQIVDETEQIEEEGIAAKPGEESVFASRRDVGLRTERGRRARDHRPSYVVQPSSQGALRQVNGRCLGAIVNIGESAPERPVGDRVDIAAMSRCIPSNAAVRLDDNSGSKALMRASRAVTTAPSLSQGRTLR